MNLDILLEVAIAKINQVDSLEKLEELRIKYLSKKGLVSQAMLELKNIPNEKKPAFGKQVNETKVKLEELIAEKKRHLENDLLSQQLINEKIDVTLPGVKFLTGSLHPLTKVILEVEDFFIAQGFKIAEGPEVESDYYNFEMMNLEANHPARDMQDSFYINQHLLLRTHTSPVQARSMLAAKGLPLAIICPGKVYRRDYDDLTHSHQFMQIEGLVIDKKISLAQLKDVLLNLAKKLFGSEREIRVRPSFFPFTEPSIEVDVTYKKVDGTVGYLEILGAGMIHPSVLKMGGYDPIKFSGFAFGVGVERIAMLKYEIDDIRNFYTNDTRFLKQFKGVSQ